MPAARDIDSKNMPAQTTAVNSLLFVKIIKNERKKDECN